MEIAGNEANAYDSIIKHGSSLTFIPKRMVVKLEKRPIDLYLDNDDEMKEFAILPEFHECLILLTDNCLTFVGQLEHLGIPAIVVHGRIYYTMDRHIPLLTQGYTKFLLFSASRTYFIEQDNGDLNLVEIYSKERTRLTEDLTKAYMPRGGNVDLLFAEADLYNTKKVFSTGKILIRLDNVEFANGCYDIFSYEKSTFIVYVDNIDKLNFINFDQICHIAPVKKI